MLYTKRMLAVASIAALFGLSHSVFAADPPVKKSGEILISESGMTLYVFDKDTVAGKSACNGPCIGLWPAVTAAADAKPSGAYSIITRDDGAKQWAYKDKPLYLWAKDQKPGDRSGDGVNGIWHVAKE